MPPIVKVSFQIFNVDDSVSLKTVVLENRDTGLITCASLDNFSVLKLRATCKAGFTIATEVFCPINAKKRCAPYRYAFNGMLILKAFAEEGELRLLQHAHAMKRRPRKATWSPEVLNAIAGTGRIDMLDWVHNKARPKIRMEHRTGWQVGAEAGYAAAGGHVKALEWLRAQEPRFPWNGQVYQRAVWHGHVHVLEWAEAQGCPTERSEPPAGKQHYADAGLNNLYYARRNAEMAQHDVRLDPLSYRYKKAHEEAMAKYAPLRDKMVPVLDWLHSRVPEVQRQTVELLRRTELIFARNGELLDKP